MDERVCVGRWIEEYRFGKMRFLFLLLWDRSKEMIGDERDS